MSVIANRYIQALLEVPKNKTENEMLENELKELSQLLDSNDEFKKVMIDPRIENEVKIEIIKAVCEKYNKDKIFMNFITLIIKENRINYIHEIVDKYEQINFKLAKELQIKIIVADTIDENQIKAIKEKYKNMYQVETIKCEIEKDKSIIGGIQVMVGNKIYDGSVATQLKQMF